MHLGLIQVDLGQVDFKVNSNGSGLRNGVTHSKATVSVSGNEYTQECVDGTSRTEAAEQYYKNVSRQRLHILSIGE